MTIDELIRYVKHYSPIPHSSDWVEDHLRADLQSLVESERALATEAATKAERERCMQGCLMQPDTPRRPDNINRNGAYILACSHCRDAILRTAPGGG